MTEMIAQTVGLGFRYRREAPPVLTDVELSVERGEFLFVIGPNGAGKTTLLKLLGGLLSPSSGRVEVFGQAPTSVRRRELARRLSYLPQSYRVSFPFTAIEIVLMGRYAHGGAHTLALESDADVDSALAAMRACEVEELVNRRFGELSGGEQRRVLLAQALCQEAELLLLDEPTASLDPAHAIHLLQRLSAAVQGGATAVVVSHDLNLAARFGTRAAIVHQCGLAAQGAPLDVLSSPGAAEAFGVELVVGTHDDGTTPFVVAR